MHEIVLPETKPALEWVNNRVLQKVSPQRKHALAQLEFGMALQSWARSRGCGMVGTEWEVRIGPPGEIRRPLVPDVTYVSYQRIPFEDDDAADIPRVAPDAVVEVLSPGDSRRDLDETIRVYLASGTDVVFVVDTKERTVTSQNGGGTRTFNVDDMVRHEALPGFEMPARSLFDKPRPK